MEPRDCDRNVRNVTFLYHRWRYRDYNRIRWNALGIYLDRLVTSILLRCLNQLIDALELLKNAFRATVETHQSHVTTAEDLPPVRITLGRDRNLLTIRIRDQGGGIGSSHPHITIPLEFDPKKSFRMKKIPSSLNLASPIPSPPLRSHRRKTKSNRSIRRRT
jgi:hypothetical protein